MNRYLPICTPQTYSHFLRGMNCSSCDYPAMHGCNVHLISHWLARNGPLAALQGYKSCRFARRERYLQAYQFTPTPFCQLTRSKHSPIWVHLETRALPTINLSYSIRCPFWTSSSPALALQPPLPGPFLLAAQASIVGRFASAVCFCCSGRMLWNIWGRCWKPTSVSASILSDNIDT